MRKTVIERWIYLFLKINIDYLLSKNIHNNFTHVKGKLKQHNESNIFRKLS